MSSLTPLDQPRAVGTARLSVKARDGASHIRTLHQSGAFKLLFPRCSPQVGAVVINTAGGITGGDRFEIAAQAGAGTHLTMTTQAAERIYRSQKGQTGHLSTRLEVGPDARLDWLPQETILFEGCALRRSLHVDLRGTARFLMVEPLLFGRRAMGEDPHDLRFDDRVDIRRDGQPLFRDGLHLWGDVAAQLDRPAIAGGARAVASIVLVDSQAAAQIDPLRVLIGTRGGASLLREDLLHLRLLAADGFELRKTLLPVLERLTSGGLPPSWRL